jgi:sulfide dehydrogenase [flavocytochrome c] flavoprotein chain
MERMTRRDFLKASATAVAVSGLAGCASTGDAPTASTTPSDLAPKRGKRVVVIGGGWGGATAAKYVRMQDRSR